MSKKCRTGLTDSFVKACPAPEDYLEVPDGRGLYLRVSPTGRKTFLYRYSFKGRSRSLHLGTYPDTSLAAARAAHGIAREKLGRGIDPGAEEAARKAEERAAILVKDLAQQFFVNYSLIHVKDPKKQHWDYLEREILPYWGERVAKTITRADCAQRLAAIVRRGHQVSANRCHAVMSKLFNWAVDEAGLLPFNPMARMPMKGVEEPDDRVLRPEEIRLLWARLEPAYANPDGPLPTPDAEAIAAYWTALEEACGVRGVTRKNDHKLSTYWMPRPMELALKLCLITGQRKGEVLGMEWKDLDESGLWWTLPGGRRGKTKNKQAHRVYLPSLAVAVLGEAKRLAGESPYVFPSAHYEGKRPVSGGILNQWVLRNAPFFGIAERWRPHNLRHTVVTNMAQAGVDERTIQRVVNHKQRRESITVYNQYRYDAEKQRAMETWEQRLLDILEGERTSNVVPLPVRA